MKSKKVTRECVGTLEDDDGALSLTYRDRTQTLLSLRAFTARRNLMILGSSNGPGWYLN